MASVTYRLKTPTREETTIICRFYSKETGPLDFTTGEKILSKYWLGQTVSAKYKRDHDRINVSLSKLAADLLDIWRNNKGASKESLKRLLTERVKGTPAPVDEKKTVIAALNLFISQYSEEKEPTTVKMYRSILKKLQSFNSALTFEQLDHNFYDKFKKHLYGSHNPVYAGMDLQRDPDADCYILTPCDTPDTSPGLFDDAVFKYVVHLKTLCAWAEKRGYQVNPAYKEWEVIRRDYPIISLTLEELGRIEELRGLPGHLVVARDYFSICCRTGQRISDVKRITSLSISSGSWTIAQKKGSRKKQKVVQLPLVGFCEPVKDIVQKYGGKLPQISEQHLNKHIKTLCELAKIDQEIFIERWQGNKKIKIPGKKYEWISCHSGKRTFVTILGSMAVPVKVISDLTGTSIRTIEKHYLGKTDMHIVEGYLGKIEGSASIKKAI